MVKRRSKRDDQFDEDSDSDEVFTSSISKKKTWAARSFYLSALMIVVSAIVIQLAVHRNDRHTWQIIQSPGGDVTVRDAAGWYFAPFCKVTTYPRAIEIYATRYPIPGNPDDDSATARFNDGGEASISWYARISTPSEEQKRKDFHRQFTGKIENARDAVRSHARQCIGQSGPVMSASEHQSARKAEFWLDVHDQIQNGLFEMKSIEKRQNTGMKDMLEKVKGVAAAEGDPKLPKAAGPEKSGVLSEVSLERSETVVAAEIRRDEKTGKPIIAKVSPLVGYGMELLQFSIMESDYDSGTQAKFKEKKLSYLEAEKSKAAALEQIQQTFLRQTQGDREVAETEWEARKDEARQKIGASMKLEVETINKDRKQTEAETLVLVKREVRLYEDLKRQIAEIQADVAEQTKIATETRADAREIELSIGGAISEHEETLLGIAVEEAELIGEALANIKVPETVIMDVSAIDPADGSPLQQALPALQLLKAFGITKSQEDFRIAPSHQKAATTALPPEKVTVVTVPSPENN